MAAVRVYLERGKRTVIAGAVDWPGWCRKGKTDGDALETLAEYAARYAAALGPLFTASPVASGSELEVVGELAGTTTTDVWAPSVVGPWDEQPLSKPDASGLSELLDACWAYFGSAAAGSPAILRKGPRGGGRDRDKMVDHVTEADRAYGRKVGVRLPPRTPPAELRAALLDAVRAAAGGTPWPVRYFVRRSAYHALDHAWEMEDRRTP